MTGEERDTVATITPEQEELERREDERFETQIFARAIVIVLFIAVVIAARATLV